MNDSLITLIHSLFMCDFVFSLGDTKMPLTLGSICSKYLKNKWFKDGYKGHQPNAEFLLGSVQKSHTPKGINSIGFAAENENLYLSSFRGGRNESFTYGVDKDTKWYDYDLASCYATIMSQNGDPFYLDQETDENDHLDPVISLCGHPNYSLSKVIHPETDITKLDLKNSYTVIKVKFNFPVFIKYPPLPVFMDKNITIYPLSGETVITGTEFLSALNILYKALKLNKELDSSKYFIKIITGSYIPFKKDGYKPFFSAIRELQANRQIFRSSDGKGSAPERIYKDLGNMIYGKTVCGISNKRNYDARTATMKSMISGSLSNPILVQQMGGKVSACTTDGFTCDIPDLEEKILEMFKNDNFDDSLLQDYKNSRDILTNGKDPRALEVKTFTNGLIQ
ncbi:hypothetical protein HOY80DRAFT_1069396 [Tuber brumale]|nr:hypothetical protein HOY80DRAFT_1069396 [Tuber brumale]